jgi:hypothetical protein
MRKTHWLAVIALGGLAAALTTVAPTTTYADPDQDKFLGTYKTEGRYNNRRKTAADIAVTKDADGNFSVTRDARYTARSRRRTPPFSWSSNDVKLEGNTLVVTYHINIDGTSVLDSVGLAGRLNGDSGGNAGAAADNVNVFVARYSLSDDGTEIREEIENTTRKDPEHWWRGIRTEGDRLSGAVVVDPVDPVDPTPDPAVIDTGRVKLGGSHEAKANGRYNVIVPLDGALTLRVSAGTVSLEGPDGQPVNDAEGNPLSGADITHQIPHTNPVLGTYVAVVSEDATLSASFVQDGRIDTRIRPWSSHTYYPIYEGSSDTMFVANGPLEAFDKVLGLEGDQSAHWWELGGDYRTGFGFEHGHYTRDRSPSERNAEHEWKADLNGDGIISTADVTSSAHFATLDTDSDGFVTEDEARVTFYAGAVKGLFAQYDGNGNGKVESGEIFASFVDKFDEDNSGDIDETEWDKAMRADYEHVLRSRSASALAGFMRDDIDSDGKVSLDEMTPPGAIDFMDNSDVDGDYNNFFDRDNIRLVTNDGTEHFGNRIEEDGGKIKLFKGVKKDELVVELDAADIKSRTEGIADGDVDDSYSVGWWGHCNAWAMASIVFRKPAGEFETNGVTLTVRQQKGMLVEYGMGDTEDSTFWWQQWGNEIDDRRYAANFHRQMHRWLRVEQKGMMADMDMKNPTRNLNFQVWNYPVLGYTATVTEAEGDDPYVLDCSVVMEKGSYSDEDNSSTATVRYRLHMDDSGNIREGDDAKTEWLMDRGSGDDAYKIYIRYLIHPLRFTGPGTSRNRNVTQERLEQVFGEHLRYNRIEDVEAEAAADAGLGGTPGR